MCGGDYGIEDAVGAAGPSCARKRTQRVVPLQHQTSPRDVPATSIPFLRNAQHRKVDSFDDEFFYGELHSNYTYEDNTRGSRKSFGAIDCCCWLGSCCCFCTAVPFVKRECQRCKGAGFVVQAKVQVTSQVGLRRPNGTTYWPEGYKIKSRWVPLGGICAGGYQVSRTGDEVLVPWHDRRWVPRPPPSSESMGRV